ncbi:hypothetical protein [Chryseolinea soli]|uniref:Uncharacterized protein n=1 Tax=Chryseolinea soli TaxID=2321403 RepID=A0A385SNV3_9BACT|nr:hypothetical protein [Chryseolinea soli]AYB32522.1 hypothetical protein D4L85_18930 [Chryseolinea soli]
MRYPRIATLLFIVSIFISLSACHQASDEPSEPEIILTVHVDADYKGIWDSWIIVSDLNGELLDAKLYTAGQTVTFSTAKAVDKMNVTFLGYDPNQEVSASFDTYTGIAKGTTLHFAASPAEPMTESKATFMIRNYTHTGLVFSNGSSNYISQSSFNGVELDVDFTFFGSPSDILMSHYREGVPVYNMIKGVVDGDVFELDFATDFVPVPHQFQLDFDGKNMGWIMGTDATRKRYWEIINTARLAGTGYSTDHPILGYIDGFDAYLMSVSNSGANGSVYYSKQGTINSSPAIPSFIFSLANGDMQALSFNFSEDYTYYRASWSDGLHASWVIHAPKGVAVQSLTALPAELAAKFPNLDLKKLSFKGISFTKVVEGKTYLETVPGLSPGDPPTFEHYIYTPN